jgi:hypothetical protein
MQLTTERLVLRPVAEGDLETLLAIRNAPEVVATTSTGAPLARERMAGQLHNEKSLRVVAKAPALRRLDDQLYELTAESLRSP